MQKKKSLGQHFLRSTSALNKIVAAAKLSQGDTVLEVGPGEGVLTELLLQQAGRVIAVEKDDRLIPILGQKFAAEIASGKLELVHADILNYEVGILNDAKKYKVVANLPYYITGQFLRKFLEGSENPPQTMVLLLQKEVAKRIVAQDGKESILSISVKAYGTPKYIDTVKAGAFSPPPSVDSGIIAIENISKKFFDTLVCHPRACGDPGTNGENLDSRFHGNDRERKFFELLKKGFAHPRKLLSSNLGISPEELRDCGIAEKARAENVSLEDWGCLCHSRALPVRSLVRRRGNGNPENKHGASGSPH